MHEFLAKLPKCEHHIHLEGSLSPELLFQLAAKNNIKLPEDDDAFASVEALYARYARFAGLDDFLHYYYVGFTVLKTQSDFEDLAYAYLSRAHSEGVRHAECFFDPQPHLERGIPLAWLVDGFTAARARANREFGITSYLIPCLLRHLPVPDSMAVFRQMEGAGYFDGGERLMGLGLCSTEMDKHPSAWKEIFELAAEKGIPRTSHAGEEGPAGFVISALDDLQAMRIDHGVHAADDEAVMARLQEESIMLSVCPLSNVALKGAKSVADVPIRTFLDKGVQFSINSDDPAYFGGYILENYCAVQKYHNLTHDEWAHIARNAVEGSWCSRSRKDEILQEINKVMEEVEA